ncbi:MAG: 1-acyl-sn-glycerol-3-phosphate acyltransferase [Bacteroidales bacterium]|nr:1-acyl-sn-glycerol-3-phosphate acyltransferase [Bacteroidales bacterium]
MEDKKYIDIASIIRDSDSKFLSRLPRFSVRLIESIIKQKKMNSILNKYANIEGPDFLKKMIEEFNLQLIIEGMENLPASGKCFFVANHPFGIIDGLILTYIVSSKYGTLKAIGNDAFMFVPHLRPLIAQVNVFGKNPKDTIIELDKLYHSDTPITHFPAGEVSRKYNGKIEDTAWTKSFITKAVESNRNIVPFYFYGRNSKLFNFIFIIRRFLGIKAYIELMLLTREMFKKQNKTIKVKIGKPINCKTFTNERKPYDWAQNVRKQVYELGK